MPLPNLGAQDDLDDTSVEILGEVTLRSFTATPDHIGPFGASNLAWSVEGPPGFHLELVGIRVQKSGERLVMPAATTGYSLTAVAGQARRTLGRVTVTVDVVGCEAYEPLLKPGHTFRAALTNAVQGRPGISLRLPPSITFSPGRIEFNLRLRKSIDWFPDPTIEIDASFGLAVSDGALVAIGQIVSADASVPWYAWAAPGALPGLAIALDGAREDARKAGREAVEGLVQLLNAVAMAPPGKRNRTVRIDSGNAGFGIIEITACPVDLLKRFAAISGVEVVLEASAS